MSATDTEDAIAAAMTDDDEVDARGDIVDEADRQGATVEDLARQRLRDQEEDDDPVPTGMQIPIPGTIESISLSAGGQRPTSSELRIMGGKVPIEGQFQKGDIARFVIEVKVSEIALVDREAGNATLTSRVHKARMLSCQRADDAEV